MGFAKTAEDNWDAIDERMEARQRSYLKQLSQHTQTEKTNNKTKNNSAAEKYSVSYFSY